MDGLTEGRIVHVVMSETRHCPAIVTHVWDKETGYINLQVILDGTNEASFIKDEYPNVRPTRDEMDRGMMWLTSLNFEAEGKTPRTWHFPERD